MYYSETNSHLFVMKTIRNKANQQEFCSLSLKQNHFLSLKPSWKCSQGKEFAANPRYIRSLQDKERKLFHHKSVSHQNSLFRPLQRPYLLTGSPALAISLFFSQGGIGIQSLESLNLKCERGIEIHLAQYSPYVCITFINHKESMHESLQGKRTQQLSRGPHYRLDSNSSHGTDIISLMFPGLFLVYHIKVFHNSNAYSICYPCKKGRELS